MSVCRRSWACAGPQVLRAFRCRWGAYEHVHDPMTPQVPEGRFQKLGLDTTRMVGWFLGCHLKSHTTKGSPCVRTHPVFAYVWLFCTVRVRVCFFVFFVFFHATSPWWLSHVAIWVCLQIRPPCSLYQGAVERKSPAARI